MGMTPYEFMDAFVDGNYDDFHANPDCIRRAFNAAVAASHMADHYYEFCKRNEPAKVSRYKRESSYIESLYLTPGACFRDIRSISNAYKHLYTRSSCSVSSAGSIDFVEFRINGYSVQAVEQAWVSSSDESAGSAGKVIYRRRDGTKGDLLDALTQVRDYWSRVIYE